MTGTVRRRRPWAWIWVQRLDDWLLPTAPPERLAVVRLAVGIYAYVNVFISTGEFARLVDRPAAEFEPVGVATLLDAPVSALVVWLAYAASVVSGAGFVAGAAFRLSGPVFALCNLAWASYHASWGQMLHFEHLVTLHLLVLGFSPAAVALSVDARWGRRSPGRPDLSYGWPLRVMAIMTVVTYVLAGVTKLRVSGWAWVDGTTLVNHIGYSATRLDLLGEPRPPLATFVVGQEWLSGPMAMGALGVELLAPLALFGGWFRRVWVPSVLLFHLGTLTTMFVFFSFNGLGLALLPLYRVECLLERRRWRGRWVGGDRAEFLGSGIAYP